MKPPPNAERMALTETKRGVEAMQAVRDGRFSEQLERLEPCEGKPSRTVLRGA